MAMKGQPIADAPRDGAEIIVEVAGYYGVPETGHYKFERVSFRDGFFTPIGDSHMHYGDGGFIQWWPANTPQSDLEKTPRTNWNFVPSNGTEGEIFYSNWCENCIHEKPIRDDYEHACNNGLGCKIFMNSMAYKISDPEYPTEWTYAPDGEPKCTAFERDQGQPQPRCTETPDLFSA